LAWLVDTANGSSNLNQYDGYVKIINGFAAGATTTTTQQTFAAATMLWLMLMRYMLLFQLKY
jgi:hypothetical protein